MIEPRVKAALAEVDALVVMLAQLAAELRYAITRVGEAQIEATRIRRELREIDADLTPVRPPSGTDVLSARSMVEGFERRKRG